MPTDGQLCRGFICFLFFFSSPILLTDREYKCALTVSMENRDLFYEQIKTFIFCDFSLVSLTEVLVTASVLMSPGSNSVSEQISSVLES